MVLKCLMPIFCSKGRFKRSGILQHRLSGILVTVIQPGNSSRNKYNGMPRITTDHNFNQLMGKAQQASVYWQLINRILELVWRSRSTQSPHCCWDVEQTFWASIPPPRPPRPPPHWLRYKGTQNRTLSAFFSQLFIMFI